MADRVGGRMQGVKATTRNSVLDRIPSQAHLLQLAPSYDSVLSSRKVANPTIPPRLPRRLPSRPQECVPTTLSCGLGG